MDARVLASLYGDESVKNCSDVPMTHIEEVSVVASRLPKCEDESFEAPCQVYADKGFCQLNPYVSRMCAKTCKLCGVDTGLYLK